MLSVLGPRRVITTLISPERSSSAHQHSSLVGLRCRGLASRKLWKIVPDFRREQFSTIFYEPIPYTEALLVRNADVPPPPYSFFEDYCSTASNHQALSIRYTKSNPD